jgi:hypothetical protein
MNSFMFAKVWLSIGPIKKGVITLTSVVFLSLVFDAKAAEEFFVDISRVIFGPDSGV